jgi:hypothetical protein
MSKLANLCLNISVTGGGRHDNITRIPIQPLTASNTSPPGLLSTNSPAIFSQVSLSSGNNVVSTTVFGYVPVYLVLVPPTGSTITKILRGANTDTGVTLANTLPVVLAITPITGNIIINSSGSETLNSWLI